jgi:hypothetical protein
VSSAPDSLVNEAIHLVRRCKEATVAQELRLSRAIKRGRWHQVELAWELLKVVRQALKVAECNLRRYERPVASELVLAPHLSSPDSIPHAPVVGD